MKIKKGANKSLMIGLTVLIVLILAVGAYFLFKELKESKSEKEMNIFQQGFNYGYTSAVIQIINISDGCQPFPIYLGNESRTLVSMDCLQRMI